MKPRKFKTGQRVIVTPNKLVAALAGGSFTVVRPLPEERGVWQYRIESIADGHERVVFEIDLSEQPATDDDARGPLQPPTLQGDFPSGDGAASG